VHPNMLDKFDKENINIIKFNDISDLDLKLLKGYKNLKELYIPANLNRMIGLLSESFSELQILECDPNFLEFFQEIKIQKYIINEEIKEIKIHNNDNPFMNTKIKSLFLYESLDIIPKDFFSCSSFS